MNITFTKPKRAPPGNAQHVSHITFPVNYPFMSNEGDFQWQQLI